MMITVIILFYYQRHKLRVSVVILSARDNKNLTKVLSKDLKDHFSGRN